jgi:penicillin amidase
MTKPTRLRRLARIAAVIAACLLLIVAAAAALLWSTLPGGSTSAEIPNLSAPVAITLDADGIPRISAATERDAAAALGFLHARERFFQMDLTRRSAAGELAELAGAVALPIDRMMRILGVRRAAEADLAGLTPETRAVIDAYTQGVNTWLARRGRFTSAEYLALGTPRPWEPVDCLLWAKAMGLYLSGNWRTELARAGLLANMKPDAIRALWPSSGGPGHPEATLVPGLPATASRLASLLPRFPDPFTLPETASDEWAVDGAHSATGAPLLAGDPHLGFNLPGIWYLARIDLPDHSLVGATAPGVPFLLLGQNGHIAWTFTNTGADVQDIFIETAAGPDRYATPDGPKPYETREERIRVSGAPDELLRVRETRHGPVISDLVNPAGPILAVAMANLMPGDHAADGMRQLNLATSVAEAQQAAPRITAPVQNLLVADKTTIAFFVTGRIPIRRSGDGSLPAPGADGAADWTGWASGTSLPQIIAPASGRLANGNERVAPPDFPVFLGADWFADWRARRIRERLASQPKADLALFASMQADTLSTLARDILPTLREIPARDLAWSARELLRNWDGTMTRFSPQPLIFQAFIQAAGRRLLAARNLPGGAAAPAGELVAHIIATNDRTWCAGDCTPLLEKSLADAVDAISQLQGPNPTKWRWGAAHEAEFPHPLLRFVPLLGPLAGASIEVDGGNDTLLRAQTDGRGFTAVQGASYRGLYDLATPERSRFAIAPGQSGHFLSTLARNFLPRWRDGASVTIPRLPPSIDATITLRPSK